MTGSVLVLAAHGLGGRRRTGVAVTFGVLLLAALGIAAGLVVSRQGAPQLDAAAGEVDVAHLVLYGDPATIEKVAADPEVVAASGPFPTLGAVELLVGDETVPMQLTALDDPAIDVSRPLMQAGRWTNGADEIVIDRSLGSDLGLGVGDSLSLHRDGSDTTFQVVGTAVSFTDCFYPQCEPGRAWVTEDGLDRFHSGPAVIGQAWLRFDEPAQADPFVERYAASGVEGIVGSESWLDTRDDFLTLDRIFGSFVTAFGVFVLAVSAVVIAGSTAMRIVARQREIGLLGAVGCTPRQVTSSLVVENLAIGAVAAIVGWFLGGLLAPFLQLGIGRTLGPQDPSWSFVALIACVAIISAVLFVATIVPAVAAARRPVTDVVRDAPRERVSWLSHRVGRLPRRLAFLGVQDVVSQPTRACLAALAIAVAVVGTLVSVGFVGGIEAVADDPAMAGDPWDVAVVRGDLPPEEVESGLRSTPAVGSWFSDVERRSTLDEGAFLSVATGGDPAAAAYQIVDGRPMVGEHDAIAGYGFLERFGVSVGDRIRFLAGTTPIDVGIVGSYRETEDSGEVLRYRMEALAAAEPGLVPDVYRVSASEGTSSAELAAALAERWGSGVRIEVLDTGVEDLTPFITVLRLIALVLVVMAGANLLSTLLTANREASGRVGVQLAVGFTPRQIVTQGSVSGIALSLVAVAVGVPVGLWIFNLLSDAVSTTMGVGPGWLPAPAVGGVVLLGAAAVAVSAALGALAVARNARRPASDLVRAE